MKASSKETDLDQSANSPAAQAGAKGMIDVGRPFLDYVLSGLVQAGITEVGLVIGPEHQIFRDYYCKLETKRVKISFIIQTEPLGTADAVRAAKDFCGQDDFLVLNSDNYYPAAALKQLTASGGYGVLGFSRQGLLKNSNIPADRIGSFAILLTEDNQMREIVEKPSPKVLAAHPQALISMNAWRFGPQIFQACESIPLSVREEYELPDAVRYLLEKQISFVVYPTDEGVLDMSQKTDISSVRAALQNVSIKL